MTRHRNGPRRRYTSPAADRRACAAAVIQWLHIMGHGTPTRQPAEAPQRNFLLVVLRRAPADLRPEGLEVAARSAWAGRFGANEDGSDYVERGVPGMMYVLQAHGNAFTVIGAEKGGRTLHPPTVFVPASAAGLWSDYTHDVSVGVTYNYDTDRARLAAFVSTLTASLCDDQSVAIYHPASRRLWKLDEGVRARLAEGSEAFFDSAAGGAP
jgi:hypothetical protein